jgi:hypothetical protein
MMHHRLLSLQSGRLRALRSTAGYDLGDPPKELRIINRSVRTNKRIGAARLEP